MAGGHFARHVKRMRGLYERAAGAALAEALAGYFPVELAAGGMHLLIRLPDGVDDGDVARRAMAAGLGPMALSGITCRSRIRLVRGCCWASPTSAKKTLLAVVARLVSVTGG